MVGSLQRLLSLGSAQLCDVQVYWLARGYEREWGDVGVFLKGRPLDFAVSAEGVVSRVDARFGDGIHMAHPPPALHAHPYCLSPNSQTAFRDGLLHSSQQLSKVMVAPAATSPPCWPQASDPVFPLSPPPLQPELQRRGEDKGKVAVLNHSLTSFLDSMCALHGGRAVEDIVTGWLEARNERTFASLARPEVDEVVLPAPMLQPLPLPPPLPAPIPADIPVVPTHFPAQMYNAPQVLEYTPHQEYRGVVELLRGDGRVLATASSVQEGSTAELVTCTPQVFATHNEEHSHFTVELCGVVCCPTHYTLAFGVSQSARSHPTTCFSEKPRSWSLEASADGITYVLLSEHIDDDAFGPPDRPHNVVVSFKIQEPSGSYVFFSGMGCFFFA